jgi:ribosome-associated protein
MITPEQLYHRHFEKEFVFSTSRSSGPGGQNVNKVSSKVELRFAIWASQCLSDDEKRLLVSRFGNAVTKEGDWIIVCQISRSQLTNKQLAIETFYRLLAAALTPVKPRKATAPTRASVARRLAVKRVKSEKKGRRGFRMEE